MDERRTESMTEQASRAAAAMQARVERASERVGERAQDLASEAGDRLAEMRGSVEPWMRQARRFVQERPLQAIGITIGLGFLLGKLLARD